MISHLCVYGIPYNIIDVYAIDTFVLNFSTTNAVYQLKTKVIVQINKKSLGGYRTILNARCNKSLNDTILNELL